MPSYSEVNRLAKKSEAEERSAVMRTRAQVQSRIGGGGAAYSADEIYWALKQVHLDHYADQLNDYSRSHHIGQTSAQLGIRDKTGKFVAGRWISQNQLVQIIEGLHIPISQEQLEDLMQL